MKDFPKDKIHESKLRVKNLVTEYGDRIIGEIADTLEPRSYTSREFIQEIGKYLKTNSKKKGFSY